jgi:hypothetical protein
MYIIRLTDGWIIIDIIRRTLSEGNKAGALEAALTYMYVVPRNVSDIVC